MTIDTLRDKMGCLGDTVCPIGHGSLGLMLTHPAKLKGAWAIVVGRDSLQLEKAREFGADELVRFTAAAFPPTATRRPPRRQSFCR